MKKILIAEDDQFLANAYRVKFEKEGFEVVIAYNGEDALEKLNNFMPDAILLDLIMPKKDGFATIADLKAHSSWKKIPIVVTSNLSQIQDFNRAKELGAIDYLVKSETPISKIVEMVRKYI